MLYLWCVITVLWSFRMSLFLGNEYWSSGQGGEICHHIHTYQMLAKWKWKVCVCLCIQVVVYCLSIFLKKKICGGNVCGKRVVPFLLSGRKRRGNATGDSDGVAAVIVTQSCPTLRSRGLQHARLPCPTTSPRVCANSCPLSQWCHPTISSFVTAFSSCPQYFPESRAFPTS